MAAIQALLNPIPEAPSTPCHPPTPPSSSAASSPATPSPTGDDPPSSHPARKKQKICKDAAIFTLGQVRGECRFPPHEGGDEHLAAQHRRFELHPIGEIADYPRHIPYNSEKKTYLGKTGRDFFEVFQYNFKVPGDDKVHCMMWDYNIGLVRITPLFRCNGYSKTTPAKMLNRNVGLREICHSITGGALVAQGYWMPYEAAKAVAATFCWSIRHALTPVFGLDFPSLCVPPDSERFGIMIIDPAITRRAAEEAQSYKLLENNFSSSSASSSSLSPRDRSTVSTPITPGTPTSTMRALPPLRPRPTPVVSENGYETEGSITDARYALNRTPPEYVYRNVWTPANTPRSVAQSDRCLPSPHEMLAALSSRSSSPALSPRSRRVRPREASGDDQDGGEEDAEKRGRASALVLGGSGMVSDERAANLLMSLRAAATALESGSRLRSRRAST